MYIYTHICVYIQLHDRTFRCLTISSTMVTLPWFAARNLRPNVPPHTTYTHRHNTERSQGPMQVWTNDSSASIYHMEEFTISEDRGQWRWHHSNTYVYEDNHYGHNYLWMFYRYDLLYYSHLVEERVGSECLHRVAPLLQTNQVRVPVATQDHTHTHTERSGAVVSVS